MPQRFQDYGVHTRNAMYQTITSAGDLVEGAITLPEAETNILEMVVQNHKNVFIEGRNQDTVNTVTQKIYATRKFNASVPATGNAFWTVTGDHWVAINTQAGIAVSTNATAVELVDKGFTYIVVTGDATDGMQATGTATCVACIVGNTFTVNGLVYTGVAGAKGNNTEFSIDTGDNETAADLADSITNDARTGITVPTLDVTATAVATNIVTVTCTTSTNLGNNIDMDENSTTITLSGLFLTGGTNTTSSYIARAHLTQL